MCHSRTNNRKINRVHERCLRIIYIDKLEKNGSVSIHIRNIQSQAIEMVPISRNMSPPIMNGIFKQKDNSQYNLTQISEFSRPLMKSIYHGRESVFFWDLKYGRCYRMIAEI